MEYKDMYNEEIKLMEMDKNIKSSKNEKDNSEYKELKTFIENFPIDKYLK